MYLSNTVWQFLSWYSRVEEELLQAEDVRFTDYWRQLADRRDECAVLLTQVCSVKMCYIFIWLCLGLIDSVPTANGHWLRVLEMLGTLCVDDCHAGSIWWHIVFKLVCFKRVMTQLTMCEIHMFCSCWWFSFFYITSILINRLVQQ